jgi:hypothetical protein
MNVVPAVSAFLRKTRLPHHPTCATAVIARKRPRIATVVTLMRHNEGKFTISTG